jgi:AcrR family transcriptional regulator
MGTSKVPTGTTSRSEARDRILAAAFAAFMEHGYAETSTLEIATRAKVSKRELYALFGKKPDLLAACIEARARRFRLPAPAPPATDLYALAGLLERFGSHFLGEATEPAVIAVFRLAIAEAVRAPAVARTLDRVGRAASRSALRDLLARARAAGLVVGDPAVIVDHFMALLWGELLLNLLLGLAPRPSAPQLARRAREATAAIVRLYGAPAE